MARLSSYEPVAARGMILLKRVLDDPLGPLYNHDLASELGPQLRSARRALDDRRHGQAPLTTVVPAHRTGGHLDHP